MNNMNQMANYMPQRNQFSSSYFNPASNNTPTNNIIWVQGIEGAKAWQLNPNSMVILLDSEADGKMYIKVSDNIGMSSLRVFNYVEEVATSSTNNKVDLSQYVTRDEIKNLVKERLDEQSVPATESTTAVAKQPKIIYPNATKN